MRTTLDIADDVLAAAKAIAKERGRTAGVVLSEFARAGCISPATAFLCSRSGKGARASRWKSSTRFETRRLEPPHNRVTDGYLLPLAVSKGGKLATFDRRLSTKAVTHGAKGLHVIPDAKVTYS